MSVVKHFIDESLKRVEIDEFLRDELERAGYGGVDSTKTPLGTHMVIYAMRPGLVIGRGGEIIRGLTKLLEDKFQVSNPQISVAEVEVPELNAEIMASRIASSLTRGVHFRRVGFWALNRILEAGAAGAEIFISGKLRTNRSRYEKFRSGYLPKSGDPALKNMQKATVHVQLKAGMIGVKVLILPPGIKFPDQISIVEEVLGEEEVKSVDSVAEEVSIVEEVLGEEEVKSVDSVAEE